MNADGTRSIRVHQVSQEGSIATAVGYDIDTGERIAFHGDWRPMRDVCEAIATAAEEDDLPVCVVEPWQLAGGV